MKHLKTTLLTFALLFAANTLKAQEKYDYATIIYAPVTGTPKIVISINGKESKELKVDRKELIDAMFDTNPVLRELNQMEDEGWELFDNGTVGAGNAYVFYMRRKEQ